MSKWIGHRNVSTTFINYYRPDVTQLTVETTDTGARRDDTHRRKAQAFDDVRRALRGGASVDHVLGLLWGLDEDGEPPSPAEVSPSPPPERDAAGDEDDDLFFR